MFEDDDTAPTVEYDDEEDSHGTIFSLRPESRSLCEGVVEH